MPCAPRTAAPQFMRINNVVCDVPFLQYDQATDSHWCLACGKPVVNKDHLINRKHKNAAYAWMYDVAHGESEPRYDVREARWDSIHDNIKYQWEWSPKDKKWGKQPDGKGKHWAKGRWGKGYADPRHWVPRSGQDEQYDASANSASAAGQGQDDKWAWAPPHAHQQQPRQADPAETPVEEFRLDDKDVTPEDGKGSEAGRGDDDQQEGEPKGCNRGAFAAQSERAVRGHLVDCFDTLCECAQEIKEEIIVLREAAESTDEKRSQFFKDHAAMMQNTGENSEALLRTLCAMTETITSVGTTQNAHMQKVATAVDKWTTALEHFDQQYAKALELFDKVNETNEHLGKIATMMTEGLEITRAARDAALARSVREAALGRTTSFAAGSGRDAALGRSASATTLAGTGPTKHA